MPNWCDNVLTVQGSPESITRFIEENQGVEEGSGTLPLSFAAQVPPDPSKEWYSEHVNIWGTKWELSSDTDIARPGPDEVRYVFQSAWAPPVQWLEAVIAKPKYKDLVFCLTYREAGGNFAGRLTGEKGESTSGEWEYVEGCIEIDGHYTDTCYGCEIDEVTLTKEYPTCPYCSSLRCTCNAGDDLAENLAAHTADGRCCFARGTYTPAMINAERCDAEVLAANLAKARLTIQKNTMKENS